MQTIVVLWTLRLAMVAAVAVAGVSWSVGTSVVESVDRGLLAAVVFTLVGGWLLDRLESPEIRLARLRRRYASRHGKGAKAPNALPASRMQARPNPATASRGSAA